MIEFENVSKQFDAAGAPAVANLSLQIDSESIVVLLGESGCGKTTTLKLINRLIEPTSGSIRIDGEDIQNLDPIELRRRIGYAFQGIGLFPHLTIAQNVALVPDLLGWSAAETQARTSELLDLVGLPPAQFAHRLPAQLSGGQQQRVGVARALAGRSAVLLMDEPFGALDPLTRDELQHELKKIQQQLRLTVVLVTHDVTEALLLADRIAVMRGGELLACDTPSRLIAEPPHAYVEQLMQMPQRQAARVTEIARAAT